MSDIAIAPGVKGITRLAVNDRAKWRVAKDANTRYDWSVAYTKLVWSRVFLILLMVALPVSLIALTPWTLMGYLALGAIPVRSALASGKVHTNYVDTKAYELSSQLKDGWKDHGDVFYKQIWEHGCDGSFRGVSSYDWDYDDRGRRTRRDVPEYTNCDHCEKRLKELSALVKSQKETELKLKAPLDEQLFESSEQFRKAVADQLEQPNIMRQISEGVSNGKNR